MELLDVLVAAYLDREADLVVLDVQTRKPFAKRHLAQWPRVIAGWSPDGKLLGYGTDGGVSTVGLWLMQVESDQVIQVAEGPFTAPVWSPDSSKFVFDRRGNNSWEIWMIDSKELEKLWETMPEPPAPAGLDVSHGTQVPPDEVPDRTKVPA